MAQENQNADSDPNMEDMQLAGMPVERSEGAQLPVPDPVPRRQEHEEGGYIESGCSMVIGLMRQRSGPQVLQAI